MKFVRIAKWARHIDKRFERWRNPKVRRVLVDSRTPMNYAVMAPIHKAMLGDPRVKFYFTASEEPARVKEIYLGAVDPAQVISCASAALMRFDAYLVADTLWAKLPRGACRIHMFHGVAGKYAKVYDSPDYSMRQWDRLFFINRRRLQNFIAAGAIDADSQAARLIGMPKIDCLVDGSLQRDAVLLSLGLDPGRPSVLYAPTWSPYSSLNVFGEDLVRRLSAAGCSVIVKLHDRSRDPRFIHSGGVDWFARLSPMLGDGRGLLATGSDACPYLAAADVLITDHSSVGFEYLLLDRPVIRMEMPELITKTDINTDYVALLREASVTVKDVSQALTAVEGSLGHPTRQSAARRAVAEELFYRPGTATTRAVRELYSVLELDPPGGH